MTEQTVSEARAAERRAAARLELGGQAVALIVAVVAWCVYLALPHTPGIRGVQVLIGASGATLLDEVFAWLGTVGMLGTALVLATRRTVLAWASWMFVTVAAFSALWAFWALGAGQGASVGFFVGLAACAVAAVAYAPVAFRKSPEQLAAEARAREAASRLDAVGAAQLATRASDAAANPLFVDDRRAQAAARHRRDESAAK